MRTDFDNHLVQRIEVLLAQALQRVDMAEGLAKIAEAKGYGNGNKYVRGILRRTDELHRALLGEALARLGENAKRGYFNRHRDEEPKA